MNQINESQSFRNASPAASTSGRYCRFSFEAKRRREIAKHANHVEAAKTEDFERWLLAFHWHNSKSADPVFALIEAAKRMGGDISEAEAVELAQQASRYPKRLSADALGAWLGVTFRQRQALRLTTIGCVDVKKRARKELRKRKDRLYQARKRREKGARPHAESLSRTKPWEAAGIGRTKWYEQRRRTDSSAPLLYSHDDEVVRKESQESKNSKNLSLASLSSRMATCIRADRTNPSAVSQRPFQAIPRPPGYHPVAAALERRAAHRHRRRA